MCNSPQIKKQEESISDIVDKNRDLLMVTPELLLA